MYNNRSIKMRLTSPKILATFLVVLGVLSSLGSSTTSITGNNAVASTHVFRSKAHLTLRPYIKSDKRSHPEAFHTVIFAVKQRNVDKLEEKLMEVSDPHSHKYGQHWTREEVGAFTENREGSAAVLSYLQSHFSSDEIAIEKRSLYDEYIVVKGKVRVWESMFATKFYEFVHKDWHNKAIHRAMEYSLPAELDAHVEVVGNVAEFPTPMRGGKPQVHGTLPLSSFPGVAPPSTPPAGSSSGPSSSTPGKSDPIVSQGPLDHLPIQSKTDNGYSLTGYVSPATIRQTYNIFNSTGNSLTSQAVYSTIGQTLSPSDLSTFQTFFGVPKQGIAASYHGYVADNACAASIDDCLEANLDFQYMMSTGQNIPTISYYDDYSLWYTWMVEVSSMTDIPKVFSMSYGSIEPYISVSERTTFNTESMKLGLQGVSLLVASGDDGVVNWGYLSGYYGCGYWPDFPSISPYWTAVGGTMVSPFISVSHDCMYTCMY